MSPGFPHPYTTNQTCDWSVGVDTGHAMRIEFYHINMPGEITSSLLIIIIQD